MNQIQSATNTNTTAPDLGSFFSDEVILTIIQAQAALKEQYQKTQQKISYLKEELNNPALTPKQIKLLQKELEEIKTNFAGFITMINKHTQSLEREINQ